jgi:nuclear receptor subfamily 1 group I
MKKEFIMSEEDKELKRKKIEQNRNKRKLKNVTAENSSSSKKFDDLEDSVITKKSVKVRETYPPSPSINADSTSSFDIEESEFSEKYQNISSTSSVEQIVEAIIETKNPTQIIQKIMKTQAETLDVMGRVIQSPQALILISHFIKNPSDGMMIISKMMDSPLDALNVFSRFMSTPTDALQIIFKIISSPTEVLQFMTELTKNPKQGLDIMKRFMASPSDILDSLLKILMNSMTKATTTQTSNEEHLSKLDFSGIESPQSMNGSLYSPRTNNSDFENFNLTDNNEQQMLNEFNQETKNVSFENSMISIINQAIKLEYNTNTSSGSHALNEQEMGKIQELIDSNRALHDPIDEDLSTLFDSQLNALEPGVHPSLTKVINLTAIAIRRLIQMSKKISGFKKLCQEDQIALLKVCKI